MREYLYNPDPWRRRAEEIRTIADGMEASITRDRLLRLAEDYELLADRAERRRKERDKVQSPA